MKKFRDLKKWLEEFSEKELDNTLLIYITDSDEYVEVSDLSFTLDDNHPIIVL